MSKTAAFRDRAIKRWPALRYLGPLWWLADAFQTLQGIWYWLPTPVRAVLTFLITTAVGALGGTKLFFLLVNKIPSVEVPNSWPVVIPIAIAIGLATYAFVLILQMRRALAIQGRAYDEAANKSGDAMDDHVNDEASQVSGDEQVEPPTGDEEMPEPPPMRPGFVRRYNMLWYLHRIKRRKTAREVLTEGIMGSFDTPTFLRVEGPYCPNDYEKLQLKDSNGFRHMSDGDDVNWAGSPYCQKCGYNERPDPNYRAPRLLSGYRTMVDEEFDI